MTLPDDATLRQHQAADPARSTWLSANAGSGKTRVLTDRVARLLLAGVDPQNILCLTYTKAAAAEMQNRLFGRLGVWAMLDDTTLGQALEAIGVTDTPDLPRARTLFARALETPGGLKIQTIHSFCSAILRRFPLEAGVAPQFTEIDDAVARRLMTETANLIAEGPDAGAFDAAARYFGGDGIEDLAKEIVAHQDAFLNGLPSGGAMGLFGLPPDTTRDGIANAVFLGGEDALLDRLATALAAGGKTDQTAAARLAPLLGRPLDHGDLPALEGLLLFGPAARTPFAAKIDGFPTKDVQRALGPDQEALNDLMVRVESARPRRLALEAALRTQALHRFAGAFLPAYRRAKEQRGWLDFDDLIRATRKLLSQSTAAAWVLYRLDGRIDHILVDEAQDTSPAQWDVIASLAQEMTAGRGADRDRAQTIFVVGDKKQSIYSFQGADPEAFDEMQAHFDARLSTQGGLRRLQLEYSFRSSGAILLAVDETYARGASATDRDGLRHRAFHAALPGRVDLWPVVEKDAVARPDNWWDPAMPEAADHHIGRLAEQVAGFITDTIANQTLPDPGGHRRRIHEGDFLILVQGRQTGLFHNLIRACKIAGLQVAGADRLRLVGELAVRDVLSLLRFAALPEDDLALAEALKSPLFGWTEQQLFSLSATRPGYLWTALRAARDAHPDTVARLDTLRGRSDFLRPYELIELVLTDLGGRARLIARLGREIEDALDELLNQALAYEQVEVPSLTGFLEWAASGEVEVKRQTQGAGRQIRVMTVHGAKGLEAPIVILPDTLKQDRDRTGQVLVGPGGVALWAGRKAEDPEVMSDARALNALADQQERDRLLYVAMTRAEKWLVVCGAGSRPVAGGTWYDKVEEGLTAAGAEPASMPTGPGLRLTTAGWSSGPLKDSAVQDAAVAPLPGWIDRAAPPPPVAPEPVNPSKLDGAKTLPGETGAEVAEGGKDWGTGLHLLLEHLPAHPPAAWPDLARTLLADRSVDDLLQAAAAILADPALAPVFAADSLAEVAISAAPPEFGGRQVFGTIDRLLVGPERVLAVDFKSNRRVPDRPEDVPEGLLRQMAAYAAALRQTYPGRRVEVAILWTRTRKLMMLPHDIVMATPPFAATS